MASFSSIGYSGENPHWPTAADVPMFIGVFWDVFYRAIGAIFHVQVDLLRNRPRNYIPLR